MGDQIRCDTHSTQPIEVESILEAMHALANETHWKVLSIIAQGPCTVEAITETIAREQSTVSKSLRRLRDFGLVAFERDKTRHVYAINEAQVEVQKDLEISVRFQSKREGQMTVTLPRAELRMPARETAPSKQAHARENGLLKTDEQQHQLDPSDLTARRSKDRERQTR